ncbi:ribonuclease P protein component [Arcanobacterium hippocoleae]|uniref:Ribonuclease P protein component n=1 Tax=Arcanobacterium hippocoleae TaxID=149017 RepID=A0ABU1T2H6_9ACTO|nr:ribonuclease P protein component [Arcanobacterium hippocoleae]MDR6939576.1 ribonuclease P protein component [Arcanobacterium hippocoleae]
MLPAANRMRKASEFQQVFRKGKKSSNALLAVYAISREAKTQADLAKVGFVVGKAVGNSVTRHKVTRRLREIVRKKLPVLGASEIVIRAFRPAADASSAELSLALEKNLRRLKFGDFLEKESSFSES